MNDLAAQLDASWQRFRAAVSPLQMDTATAAGWTAKEMVGHLGFWLEAGEGVVVAMFRGMPLRAGFEFGSGYVPEPDAPWPIADVHNAREAAWAKPRTSQEVVARLDAGHARLAALVESLDPSELADERYLSYVQHMCTELDAHLEELAALLSET